LSTYFLFIAISFGVIPPLDRFQSENSTASDY
jgi:hypothetical protein